MNRKFETFKTLFDNVISYSEYTLRLSEYHKTPSEVQAELLLMGQNKLLNYIEDESRSDLNNQYDYCSLKLNIKIELNKYRYHCLFAQLSTDEQSIATNNHYDSGSNIIPKYNPGFDIATDITLYAKEHNSNPDDISKQCLDALEKYKDEKCVSQNISRENVIFPYSHLGTFKIKSYKCLYALSIYNYFSDFHNWYVEDNRLRRNRVPY